MFPAYPFIKPNGERKTHNVHILLSVTLLGPIYIMEIHPDKLQKRVNISPY